MAVQTELKVGKNPRSVIRGLKSQIPNETGIHWLRNSFPRQYLKQVRAFCDVYFGKSSQDGYGLWSYDTRYVWPNGASLNYDSDTERSISVHNGKVTLDITGKALDGIDQGDLHLFLLGLRQFSPTCTRVDVFFDDYQRLVTPSDLHDIVDNFDFSGFRSFNIKQRSVLNKGMVHDEVDFGKRGGNGSGKYLRVYDKALESEGKKNCVRYEIEFTKERAHDVFDKLSQTTSTYAFATLCGSLVAGSIVFVHRTVRSGDKNISRLEVYDFWQQIKELLGTLVIRIPVKKNDIAGMHRYVDRQVCPTLATLRETFIDDTDFFNWLNDRIGQGELRMSQRQINLAKAGKRTLRYCYGKVVDTIDGVLVA